MPRTRPGLAVLVSADPNLREELAGLHNAELFRTCAWLAEDSQNDEDGEEVVLQATRITLYPLAQRIRQLTEQIQDLEGRLARLVERHAPQLLTAVGIGPDTAVTLLITMGDNPERLCRPARLPSTRAPRTTMNAASRRARPDATSSDASHATSPERSFTSSSPYPHGPRHRGSP
ncbi:transposase [Streptomyces sp. SA15]|uniref:transposase n=1 Tax=Streptomyces sp. SA15 TaxID=934019 RepID=UPI00211CD61A|nr:transposase [Streptomyces sp. SA15]